MAGPTIGMRLRSSSTEVRARATNVFAVEELGRQRMALRGRIILVVAAAMAAGAACTPSDFPTVGRAQLVSGLDNVLSVTTGEGHSCALRMNGSALCWGTNRAGEFGDGETGIDVYTPVPTPVSGLNDAVALSTGLDHTCAVVYDGTAKCWGANANGQLGDGTLSPSLVPTPVDGLTGAVAIAAGGHFTCALTSGGQVECWGANTFGQLGIGTTADHSTPTPVPGIDDATAISVGTWTACAVRASGSVACWGYNGSFGLLGNGTTGAATYSANPVAVSGLTGAATVAILSRSDINQGTVCAQRNDGTVWCWGARFLGDGTTNDSPVPVQVSGLHDAVSVSASSVPCALRPDGTVDCWRDDTPYGLLGDGHTTPARWPIQLQHVHIDTVGAIALSTGTGSGESCVVLAERTVMCWGVQRWPGYIP
jgi:alpha-tubulin suppressor-like RCC1 family protein